MLVAWTDRTLALFTYCRASRPAPHLFLLPLTSNLVLFNALFILQLVVHVTIMRGIS